tara:strand:- start:11441 stop:11938 length:498 start_codon:yes stop_codon:yes gene_type:complete
MNKFKNGWEIIPKKNIPIDIKDAVTTGVEQDTVIRIMSDLLDDAPDKVGWYFNEVHSAYVDEADVEKIYDELPNDWSTVYDSSWLHDQASSGYNIIQVGYGDVKTINGKKVRNKFICLSLNGSWGASALSEYFKVVVNNEYPDQVDPADEDHIYFNADPNEKSNY